MNLLSLSLESLLPLCRARLMIKVAIVVACCGLCSGIPAVSPAPDGGYPNNNTAEGTDAVFNLTTGSREYGHRFSSLDVAATPGKPATGPNSYLRTLSAKPPRSMSSKVTSQLKSGGLSRQLIASSIQN